MRCIAVAAASSNVAEAGDGSLVQHCGNAEIVGCRYCRVCDALSRYRFLLHYLSPIFHRQYVGIPAMDMYACWKWKIFLEIEQLAMTIDETIHG